MISTKIYTQRLDLKDVNLIYDVKEKSCMKLLREIYKSKCFKGSYILDIIEIVKTSDVSLSTYHLDVRGNIWVTFIAKIIEYSEDDLISNCKIIRKIENKVFAKVSHGIVILLTHDLLRLVKEGDTIPIIVKKSKYTPLRDSISIFAKPFTPSIPMNRYVYVLIQPMNPKEIKKMKLYVEHAKKLKEWGAKLKGGYAKKLTYFDQLFYPFKKQEKPKLLSTNKNDVSLLDFLTLDYTNSSKLNSIKMIIPSPEISRSQPFVLTADISSKDAIKKTIDGLPQIWNIIEDKTFVVFEALMISYIKYLTFLQDMVKEYDDINTKNIFWKAIQSYKR